MKMVWRFELGFIQARLYLRLIGQITQINRAYTA